MLLLKVFMIFWPFFNFLAILEMKIDLKLPFMDRFSKFLCLFPHFLWWEIHFWPQKSDLRSFCSSLPCNVSHYRIAKIGWPFVARMKTSIFFKLFYFKAPTLK